MHLFTPASALRASLPRIASQLQRLVLSPMLDVMAIAITETHLISKPSRQCSVPLGISRPKPESARKGYLTGRSLNPVLCFPYIRPRPSHRLLSICSHFSGNLPLALYLWTPLGIAYSRMTPQGRTDIAILDTVIVPKSSLAKSLSSSAYSHVFPMPPSTGHKYYIHQWSSRARRTGS